MEKQDIELTRLNIQTLGLDAIKEYFGIESSDIDKDTIALLHQKAKLAMQFEREMNLNKRAVELNYIRVFRLIAEDKAELKKYIKKAMPKYYPA